ncbi:2-dehydropantoate 2-reductase [Afipia clevelandensis]|uniref:2-dehydropantoate 2-reductase n=1 Tax=Afipia clevelandensis ATCC 49720 TaxID=883079 RepID=K8P689_9BRAD|nr:2-dehydropantoate 2-reductase [Afipia clevelandensis]EKS33948.1 2-dehydropantoate 2-reductase [Afipia clevelandensis ATCC 49720]
MRILVIGAGATGGYFGGRLLQAGRDVTFLVRPKRAELLAKNGLVIKSPAGDVTLKNPPTIVADKITTPFDVIILSCKAYDLDDAVSSFAAAVGPDTAIIPFLNGMKHLDVLDAKFGIDRVMGGQCQIASMLDADGVIHHLAPMQSMSFGERGTPKGDRAKRIEAALQGAMFEARASDAIMQEMYEKWVFLATLAGATSLMRAAAGVITGAPGGEQFIRGLRAEIASVAEAAGHAPRAEFINRTDGLLFAPGSQMTASMLRDIRSNARIEADQIIGDLIHRAETNKKGALNVTLLRIVYTHLKAYESQRP